MKSTEFEQANLSNLKAKANPDVSSYCYTNVRKATLTYRIYLVNVVQLKQLPYH